MDQAQYWMWLKRREIFLRSHYFQAASMKIADSLTSDSSSWEEKAFAEDAAAGSLGGCMWPPRSYSCSFCKRDFNSAQALGGHMNVHRRDRARLKQQSLCSHNDHHQVPNQNHSQNPIIKSSDVSHFPSEFRCVDHNLDTNTAMVALTTPSTSRVSAVTTQQNLSEHSLVSPSIFQEQHKVSRFAFSSGKPEVEKIISYKEDSTILNHEDDVETNLSIGLNFVGSRNRPTMSCGDEATSCKRPKTAISLHQFEALGFKSSSMVDNLDLELRLGNPPKVK